MGSEAPVGLAPALLAVLVCPQDKGPLWYFQDEASLYNERLKRRYEVRNNNIPVLLIDDAETVDEAEHQRLVAKASSEALTATGTSSGQD